MSKNLPYRQRPSITCWGDSHLMSHHHFAREFCVANSETGVSERYQLPEINATSGAKLDMAVVNKIITSMDENNFLQRPQVVRYYFRGIFSLLLCVSDKIYLCIK